jgi:dihydroneopterin aldolase
MINTIHIERLALHGYHGVMSQERKIGTMFYVTLHIDVEVTDEALHNDNLNGTVSYADVIASVREEMSTPAALLEHLAYRVGQRLLYDFSAIKSLSVRIDKENPPCGVCVDNIGVSMNLCR